MDAGGDVTPIVRLVTPAEREAAEQVAYEEAARDEAIDMLERALAIAREGKTIQVAIVFVLDDGSYGRLMPVLTPRMGLLIGAAATLQHDLILKTLVP